MHLPDCYEVLFARTMGNEILNLIQTCDLQYLAQQVNSDAVALLEEIRAILDDQTLDDPTCFFHIDSIVRTFYAYGLDTCRHQELG